MMNLMKQKRFVNTYKNVFKLIRFVQIVEQFQRDSEPLQELLLKRAKTEENWVCKKSKYNKKYNFHYLVIPMVA